MAFNPAIPRGNQNPMIAAQLELNAATNAFNQARIDATNLRRQGQINVANRIELAASDRLNAATALVNSLGFQNRQVQVQPPQGAIPRPQPFNQGGDRVGVGRGHEILRGNR